MAGKSWQTSHEPPGPRGKKGTRHTDKNSGKRGGGGGGREGEIQKLPGDKEPLHKRWLGLCSKNITCSASMWNSCACAQRDTTGHRATLVLFVVNCVKLHLTTLKN